MHLTKTAIWRVRASSLFLYVQKLLSMDAKLTLKLDKYVIDKAKEYASSHKRSLSRMIESYLKSLIDNEAQLADDDIEISPFVRSMQTGGKLPADFDLKKERADYLAEKYK